MTKYKEFNERIKNLFGGKQGYKRNFAITIGVSPQTVYYWCSGKRANRKPVNIPEYVWVIVELLESIWIPFPNQPVYYPERWLKYIKGHGIY